MDKGRTLKKNCTKEITDKIKGDEITISLPSVVEDHKTTLWEAHRTWLRLGTAFRVFRGLALAMGRGSQSSLVLSLQGDLQEFLRVKGKR